MRNKNEGENYLTSYVANCHIFRAYCSMAHHFRRTAKKMTKNKLYRRKEKCDKCGGQVIYNETHHWLYCNCTPPVKVEVSEAELAELFIEVKK